MTIQVGQTTRRVPTPATTGQLAPPISQQGARRSGEAIQQVGRALQQLGGDAATMALNIERSQHREELKAAQLSHLTAWNAGQLELEKDPDVASLGERAGKLTDTIQSSIFGNAKQLKSQAARNGYTQWAAGFKSEKVTSKTLEGWNAHTANIRRDWKPEMMMYVEQGRLNDFLALTEGRFEGEAISEKLYELMKHESVQYEEKWQHKQALDAAYNTADALLREIGLDEARKEMFKPINSPGLTGEERLRLLNDLDDLDGFYLEQADFETADRIREQMENITTKTFANDAISRADIEAIEGEKMRGRAEKIKANYASPVQADVKWKDLLDLQEEVISFLAGTKFAWTRQEAELQIAEAATTHQQISRQEMNSLITMLDTKLSQRQFGILKSNFDRIREEQNTFFPLGLSEEEAKRISNNRYTEIADMIQRTGRKKDDSLTDSLTRSIEIDVASRPPLRDVLPQLSPFLGPTTVFPQATEETLAAARQAIDEIEKEKLPTAPAKVSEEFPIWQEVRNKWHSLPVSIRIEITTALLATNPATGNKFTWNEIVTDPIIAAELEKIE